uniref:Uncharacterized protein n=1 Tax=Oryza rufipogon TaxID=4529 RepID=A0A0E0R540_ORYRU
MSIQVVGPPPVPPPSAPPLPPERQLSGEFVDVELGNVSSTVVDVDPLRQLVTPSAPPLPPETMNPPPRRQLTGEFVDVELGNAGLSTVQRRRRQRTTARSADDEDGLCSMVCAAVIVLIFMVAIVVLLNKYVGVREYKKVTIGAETSQRVGNKEIIRFILLLTENILS